MLSTNLLVFLLCLAVCTGAGAGPLDEKKGEAHLSAVAAANIDQLMADYAEDAFMEWVGGPLDGRYRGRDAIREVWRKFIALNEGQPRPVHRSKLSAYTNPKGASIEAEAEYGGKLPLKVWHVLVYRDGTLSTELWQIAPGMKIDD